MPENCSDRLKEAFKKVAATIYTNVSTPVQYAAIRAYEPNYEIEEYFKIIREIHRIMGTFMSNAFNGIDGIKATMPRGSFYFFADFNEISEQLVKRGVKTSNELMSSLISHPFHIAAVTGDACLLDPDDFGARIAFVDYDGKAAFEDFKANPPENLSDEIKFVQKNAPRMVDAIGAMENYLNFIKDGFLDV